MEPRLKETINKEIWFKKIAKNKYEKGNKRK